MKTRIIVGVIGVPLLFILILFAPIWMFGAVLGAIAAIAAWELLKCVCADMPMRMVIYACVGAFLLPFGTSFGNGLIVERFVLWALVLVMFGELMISFLRENRMPFEPIVMVLFAGFVLPMLFTSLIRISMMNHGSYLLLMVFIVAFASDSCAYFAGMFLGKHKLAPVVSPNKTIEGALGGLAAGILAMLLYTFILDVPLKFDVSYGAAVVYGLVGCLAGELGDLCFSVIKRQTGIKDYGNILPGHGGILDRFDSMLFIAPLIELLLLWVPAIM